MVVGNLTQHAITNNLPMRGHPSYQRKKGKELEWLMTAREYWI